MLKTWCVKITLNKILLDAYKKTCKVVKCKKNIRALRMGVMTLVKRFQFLKRLNCRGNSDNKLS